METQLIEVGRSIPEANKREARQACFFGCVLCGSPLFTYDHVVDFAETRDHSPDNLALLCFNHHADKTAGRLSRDRVRQARLRPFNSSRDTTSAYRFLKALSFWIDIGSVITIFDDWQGDTIHLVWINGQSFFKLHKEVDGLTFSLRLTDEHGKHIFCAERGEIIVNTAVWDYRYEGDRITIRGGIGQIVLELRINDERISVERGSFFDDTKTGLRVTRDGIKPFDNGHATAVKISESIYRIAGDAPSVGVVGITSTGIAPDFWIDRPRFGLFMPFDNPGFARSADS